MIAAGVGESWGVTVLVNLGANDAGTAEGAYTASLGYVVDAYHTVFPAARVYVSLPWRRGLDVTYDTMAGWISGLVAARAGWCFVADDERSWLEGGDDGVTMTIDGIHYSAAGNTEKTAQMLTVLGY